MPYGLNHTAVHQAEIAGIVRNADIGHPVMDAVEEIGSQALGHIVCGTLGTAGKYNLIWDGTDPTNTANRAQLLSMLGSQNVYVLGGHIHKFNWLVRCTSS